MQRYAMTMTTVCLVAMTACADVWAGGIARDIDSGLKSIVSYRGTTIESGLGDTPVERSVLYARPWRLRVETTTPGAHQGELFVYDGNTVTLYYPQLMFAVRIAGVRAPSDAEALHHIERLTRTNLKAYTFALQSESARVAGQRALDWVVRPATRASFRMNHRVWNHAGTTLPLKMQFQGEKAPWYTFEFSTLQFGVPVERDAFTVTLPRNTVVFDWDLEGPGISLDDARATMNFPVQLPTRLPAGHTVRKIVPSEHCLPMLAVAMEHDGSQLMLIESRASGVTPAPLGIEVSLGETTGTLSFLGGFSTITWVRDGAQLTLTGNLDFPTMIDIAASVR